MLHQNSVFHGLLKLVPWHKLERSVEKHGADERSRKLTTKRHLTALLYGQFSGAIGLREIVGGMASHETRLYHLGAAPVKRSALPPQPGVGDIFNQCVWSQGAYHL
jgi:hypothetical protein